MHSPPKPGPESEAAPRSWIDRIVDGGEILSSLSVVLILILVCAEVIFRLFNRSTMVADELGAYLNAAIVFLGMTYTLREGGFIRIELIVLVPETVAVSGAGELVGQDVLHRPAHDGAFNMRFGKQTHHRINGIRAAVHLAHRFGDHLLVMGGVLRVDRKSTRLNSSHRT